MSRPWYQLIDEGRATNVMVFHFSTSAISIYQELWQIVEETDEENLIVLPRRTPWNGTWRLTKTADQGWVLERLT